MKLMTKAAMLAAPLCLAFAVPAMAQSDPFVGGEFVEVTGVSVDDGHYLDYANFLAGFYKAQEDFAVSQGWEMSWEIMANVYKRKGEPDLYLIRRYKDVTNGAEADRRDAIIRDHVKQSTAQMEASSGDRAKFRHIDSSMLLVSLKLRK